LRDEVAEHAHGGAVAIAVEGCTGWRYVVEEVVAAGFEADLAEPADTQAARGRKRRAKTDRSDCRLLRELLADGRLPASWIALNIVLEWRERARLLNQKTLVDQRSTWVQRIHAELYQHGVPLPERRRSAGPAPANYSKTTVSRSVRRAGNGSSRRSRSRPRREARGPVSAGRRSGEGASRRRAGLRPA
jgi:hypothetical protein